MADHISMGQGPQQARPNILMIFPDQWRGDWVHGVSGINVRTPNIDALIESGVSFGRAWTPSPICAPARTCLSLGKSYDNSPVRHNKDNMPLNEKTFFRRLLDSGYRVANLGKSDLLKQAQSWGKDGRHIVDGVDRMAEIGFSHGFDCAGKHDSISAAKDGCNEPYTNMLQSRGLIDSYVDDFERRSLFSHDPVPLADWLSGSWSEPVHAYTNVDPVDLPEDAYSDNYIGQAALDILKQFNGDEPWFTIVNFPGPHEPMDVTADMAGAWKDIELPDPVGCHHTDLNHMRDIRRNYASMLENIDRWVGKFIALLRDQGQYENTVIVFASDHGEMLGDKNLWQKEVPYEPSVNVPFVMSGPGILPKGHLPDTLANLIDLPPTFLKLAGLAVPDDYDGFNLGPFLRGEDSPPRTYNHTGLGAWRAVTDGRYKAVVGLDDTIPQVKIQFGESGETDQLPGQFFDLKNDPLEQDNLWETEKELRKKLISQLPNQSS